MKPLPKTLFSGSENIGEQDREKIFVNNFSDSVEKVLGDFFWDGKAAGAIGLTLSNDNKRVESGRFITTGTLVEKSLKVAANEIWEDADESVILTIKLPRADIFKFTDGGLYSQYVDEESVTYYMHSIAEGKPPTPIPVQEKEEWQIGKFCLRQVCYVSKSSTARGGVFLTYVVLIFPTSKDHRFETLLWRDAVAAQANHTLEMPCATPSQDRIRGAQSAQQHSPPARHRGHHAEVRQPRHRRRGRQPDTEVGAPGGTPRGVYREDHAHHVARATNTGARNR